MDTKERESTDPQEPDETNDAEATDELTDPPINIFVVTPSGQRVSIQVTRQDTIQDIRQFLLDEASTCLITSYHLEHNRKALNDFAELEELQELADGDQLFIIEDEYNEITARAHLRKFREIVFSPTASSRKESPSLYTRFAQESSSIRNVGPKENVALSVFFPESELRVKCLKKILMSGWNPVPHYRRIQGDLFYLEAQTIEGTTLTITSSTNGFFVNASKQGNFNPTLAEREKIYHSLVDLLETHSKYFKDNIHDVLQMTFGNTPLLVDALPVPYPIVGWLARPNEQPVHSYEPSRAEEYVISTAEIDYNIQGQARDWNEELQQARDMPKENISDRTARDRALFRAHYDYVDAAVRGAVTIIDGCVPPINPIDEPKAHMFIYNNIFFSYAVDSRDIYKDIGGDEAAYKQASNDLLGVAQYNKVDVTGLHTSGTAIIDYRGKRMIAQTIIPGLFSTLSQEDGVVNIGYGSLEGSDYNCTPEFHKLMTDAAEKLLIKPHTIVDKNGTQTTLASHGDIKGILGSDQRKYILDLVRCTPRDANYPEPHHIGAILRPELLEHHSDMIQLAYRKEKLEEIKAQEKERQQKIQEQAKHEQQQQQQSADSMDGTQKMPTPQYIEDIKKLEAQHVQVPPFNPDTFTTIKQGDSQENIEKDQQHVKSLAELLKNTVIPNLVEELVNNTVVIVDSATLVNALHQRGINLRYLGSIITSVTNTLQLQQQIRSSGTNEITSPVLIVLLREVIVRATKKVFGTYLEHVKDAHLASAIAALLNTFFGKLSQLGKGSKSGWGVPVPQPQQQSSINAENSRSGSGSSGSSRSQKLINRISDYTFTVSHDQLWAQIRKVANQKYNYELPELIPNAIFSLSTLRSICLKVGIQLVARDYDMAKEHPFKFSDIVRIFPVVKHYEPKSKEGHELLETGRAFYLQGRFDVAFDLLNESLNIFQQVYGALQKDVAVCHSSLARLLLAAGGDLIQAISHQQKSLVINERVLGLDHYETAVSYLHLGLYTNAPAVHTAKGIETSVSAEKRARLAVNFLKRANYLNHVIGGLENPENISTFSHLGGALQDLGERDEALYCLGRALLLSEQLFGEKHIQTARLNHQLAIAQQLAGNFKQAIEYETKNYEICKQLLGEKHLQTMEANIWLTSITRLAVQEARTATKKQKTRHSPLENVHHRHHVPPMAGASAVAASSPQELSDLSIQDLVNFIQDPAIKSLNRFGSSSMASGPSRMSKGGIPKRTYPGGAKHPKTSMPSSASASSTQQPSQQNQPNHTSTSPFNTQPPSSTTQAQEQQPSSAPNKKKRNRKKKGNT